MKIHSGRYKGRKLRSPPDETTSRPMPDRVKGAIFNLLRGHVEGETVIDLFAGIGTMGLEAYSRGAARVAHVERDKRVLRLLEENITALEAGEVCEVVSADALGPLTLARVPKSAHLIFADPPYALVRERAGFERVRTQLSKLVRLLDDTGYLVLRVPHPLLFEAQDPAHDNAPGRVRLSGDPNAELERLMAQRIDEGLEDARAGGDRVVITSLDDPAWDDLDTFEDELYGDPIAGDAPTDTNAEPHTEPHTGTHTGTDAKTGTQRDLPPVKKTPEAKERIGRDGVTRVEADLTIAGALGPEIHTYADMDVCLYMRDPEADA